MTNTEKIQTRIEDLIQNTTTDIVSFWTDGSTAIEVYTVAGCDPDSVGNLARDLFLIFPALEHNQALVTMFPKQDKEGFSKATGYHVQR